MQNAVTAVILAVVLGGLAGCAQRNEAISTAPAHEELPTLTHVERIVPAKVAVEHRRDALDQLVPEFVEPQATPEELAALGQREELFSYLPYNLKLRQFDRMAGPYDAGVTTGIGGLGGVRTGSAYYGPVWGISGHGGVTTGSDTFGSYIAQRYLARQPASAVGPREEVRVETGSASHIAAHRRTND